MANADSFVRPTWAEARACTSGAARIARFSLAVRAWEQDPAVLLYAGCVSCGKNTGNWCEICASAGLTFTSFHGQPLVGNPLCSRCETLEPVQMESRQQNIACHVCTGTVTPMPPASEVPNQPIDIEIGENSNVAVHETWGDVFVFNAHNG